jgi:hypothetical protein
MLRNILKHAEYRFKSTTVTPNLTSHIVYVVLYFNIPLTLQRGPGSVVGIATDYGMDGPGIEYRWGVTFSSPVQTSPRTHPASCTMDTASFPGVKSGRGVTLIPQPP